jgi:hypothetical protein
MKKIRKTIAKVNSVDVVGDKRTIVNSMLNRVGGTSFIALVTSFVLTYALRMGILELINYFLK